MEVKPEEVEFECLRRMKELIEQALENGITDEQFYADLQNLLNSAKRIFETKQRKALEELLRKR